MDSSLTGDLDELRADSILQSDAASVPVGAVEGGPVGIAAIPASSVLPDLERRSWPEWARASEPEVKGLQPRRAAAAGVGFSRNLIGWKIVWRDWSPSPGVAVSLSPASIVAIALCTSIVVSLFTTAIVVSLAVMWLPDRAPVAVAWNDQVPMVTVSYEPIEPAPSPEPAPIPTPTPTPTQPIAQPVVPVPLPSRPVAQLEGPHRQPPRPIAQPPAPPRPIAQPVASALANPAVKAAAPAHRTATARGAAERPPSDFVVTSEPEGAHVTINGIGYGLTPISIRFLPPGAKRVRVTMTGYESAEQVVGADTRQASVTLRLAQHTLTGQRQAQ